MLYIGTPSQEFALIVDSGSTVTYVPCATCEQCGNHQIFVRQKNRSSSKAPDNPIKETICHSYPWERMLLLLYGRKECMFGEYNRSMC
ncbi:hypothetical protein E2562_027579 [Oryza meyeriana var. granulata]|uniref:Peptidase A1 domain-containing protein n=1 Tax=Oryza meyeriana var. granulata TaxID=110450 RepID=A0A6G1DNF5_9ORYZ|nr:hypothetical protein E2562_027579 [Oryza meyeriana var. granulata]